MSLNNKEACERYFGFTSPPMAINMTLDFAAEHLERLLRGEKQRVIRSEERGKPTSSGESPKGKE